MLIENPLLATIRRGLVFTWEKEKKPSENEITVYCNQILNGN
jgi:hypothetical protein